jgi:hypothetical protein
MEWVNSGGGPLICAEERISVYWMGIYGLSATCGSTQTNDYARACSSHEYLEAIACGDGYVLALGDEPLQSTFFITASGEVAIARWIYALSSDQVEMFLRSPIGNISEIAATIPFDVSEGPLILFDSALRGTDPLAHFTKADVQPGSYHVTTEKHQSDNTFSFIVHRLLKDDRSIRRPRKLSKNTR